MSLRLRLTLLYTSLSGGALLVFGALVYGLVSTLLMGQVDSNLQRSATDLIGRLRITVFNQFDPRSLADFQTNDNVFFQLWDNDRQLVAARPAGLRSPIDEAGRWGVLPELRTVTVSGVRLRVLSVPLKTNRGPAGTLQIAISMALVDATQQILSIVLGSLVFLIMALSWFASWLVTGRALAPLSTATEIATQITRADDLSRRIPLSGASNDEIGMLIDAFNQILQRMEQLFISQRRFVADVSHELRTPLTVIKGNLGLMEKVGYADKESIDGIHAEADRLTRLVGDLLLLVQADSGKLALRLEPVEMDTVLLEVVQQMKVVAGEKLLLHVSEIDQVQVNGDRDRLKQVLMNLVGNAIQYTPAGGQVAFSIRKKAGQAQILISDTGPGIPSQDLPHIFERFYRGEKSRRRGQSSGSGLGLPIAQSIIRSHHGTIEVSSQEGKGTTFCIWLPLLKEAELPAAPDEQTPGLQKAVNNR